ncbi:hypothetical protein [Marinitoga litoralis]|uniref:hypothetical protein n=1 Tax=Marinitoga litoralis TaxID=570855 RepID=UPI00196083CD|nr:hypothetical protein [Marinitoga litoralis]MBM7560243.1 hypothetical protein [Marinitoga litoralis]
MKKVMIAVIVLISLITFGFNIDLSNDITFSKNIWTVGENSNIGIWVSYPIDFSYLPGVGLNYNDKNEFFTTQKVFLKTIKLKAGERYFNLNAGYDFEKNSIVLSTAVKKYKNDLISKSFSYSHTKLFKNGSEERKISLDRYLIPTIAKVSIFSTSYNNSGINYSISNYGIQIQRYFTVPFVLGISDLGYSVSVPIGVFDDKYISGYFAYGILYNEKYYPFFNFQVPFNKQYYLGIQMRMSNDANFMIYLSKLNIDNPISIIVKLNENNKFEGGFFFEY